MGTSLALTWNPVGVGLNYLFQEAVSTIGGVLLVGVLASLLFGVHVRAPDFWNLPRAQRLYCGVQYPRAHVVFEVGGVAALT